MIGALLAKVPEWVFRVLGVLFFLGVVAWRVEVLVVKKPDLRFWIPETLGYVLIVVGYLRRAPAFERAARWYEVLLPLVGGPFPFVFSMPFVLAYATRLENASGREVCWWLEIAGDAIMVVSYAYLAGSFSILVEARPLKDRGPYRWIRHPVYLGQLVTFLGIAVENLSPITVALWVTFAAIQVTRAILEERKLARATPGYAEYRARTSMFLPFVI